MKENDIEILFRELPEVEPSAALLRRIRSIPLEQPRVRSWSLFSLSFTKTFSTLAAALAMGFVLGSVIPDPTTEESDLSALMEADSSDFLEVYGEFE